MKLPPIPIFNNEIEVQFWYTQIICNELKCQFNARFKTDGIYQQNNIKILAEYKFGGNLKNQNFLTSCVSQVLCYIKKIENSGELLPNLIFIANEKEFCLFDSIELSDYLNLVDSSMIPSSIFSNTPEFLVESIGTNLKLHINNIENLPIISTMLSSYNGKSGGLKMTINNNNIISIFGNFISSNIIQDKLDPNEEVQLFASIIFNECNDIVGKPNQILTPLSNKQLININRHEYDSFLKIINSINRPSSKDEIVSQSDRLISEISRRFHGEFYTPKPWVDEGHNMIIETFTSQCYDEYVWWDPCCGVGNLTRDYKFKELYCSTLHQVDIDIMNQRNYNPEAIKFQYDFLNDDVYQEGFIGLEQDKLEVVAPELVKAFKENRKIIMIMNPPYGQTGGNLTGKENKKGIVDVKTKNLMKIEKYGLCISQLYTHFIYRCLLFKKKYNLTNLHLCIYSPLTYLCSPSFKKMREDFLSSFSYDKSFLFNAGEFADVKSFWGILFAIWNVGKTTNKELFQTTIKTIVKNSIKIYNNINLYNTDFSVSGNEWIKEPLEFEKSICFSSALKYRPDQQGRGCKNFLGYFSNAANDVGHTVQFNLLSSCPFTSIGTPFTKNNYNKIISLFTAKKLSTIGFQWYDLKKEFLMPDENHPEYYQWNIDCIVHSLFNGFSHQASLRNPQIQNEFFWLSNEQMTELADSHGFTEMYRDAKIFNQDRFVYNELTKIYSELSQDAKDVLEKVNNLVIKIIDKRKYLHNLHPEWHLHAWDAGWYQIKLILKDSFKSDLKEFSELYKKFEDRMRDGVYKFGFLK